MLRRHPALLAVLLAAAVVATAALPSSASRTSPNVPAKTHQKISVILVAGITTVAPWWKVTGRYPRENPDGDPVECLVGRRVAQRIGVQVDENTTNVLAPVQREPADGQREPTDSRLSADRADCERAAGVWRSRH